MKKHEKNAADGDLFTSGGEEFEQVKEEEISSNGKVIDLVLPVLVLIGTAIGAMIYTGFLGGATDVVTAFAGCDAETSLDLCDTDHGNVYAGSVSSAQSYYI